MPNSPERLAYWYFRLNGFLTIEDFVVHPEQGTNQQTDADILAVRFGHRAENSVRPMEDDPRVALCDTPVNVIIAEVKTGACALNGPWSRPEAENIQRVLRAIGCVPDFAVGTAAAALYDQGRWADCMTTVRLFAFGETRHHLTVPAVQVTWSEVVEFCVTRFSEYRRQKAAVGQWTEDGKRLKRWAETGQRTEIRKEFGL